jgi:hypothetical protein
MVYQSGIDSTYPCTVIVNVLKGAMALYGNFFESQGVLFQVPAKSPFVLRNTSHCWFVNIGC